MGLYFLIASIVFVVCLIMTLFVMVTKSDENRAKQQADQEAKIAQARATLLQESVDNLRARSDQDVGFFELVRQFLVAQNAQQREALIGRIKGFKFSEPTPSSTTSTRPSPSATRASPTTTTTSTTTTTMARSPPPPSTTCVSVLLTPKVCV